MELLEIAKANAAKALGTAKLELPASLRAVLVSKETDRGTAVPNRAAQFQVSILRLSKQNLWEASARKIDLLEGISRLSPEKYMGMFKTFP